jgi:hypothetical protein
MSVVKFYDYIKVELKHDILIGGTCSLASARGSCVIFTITQARRDKRNSNPDAYCL